MRTLVFASLVALAALPALAADKVVKGSSGIEYVVPDGSPVGAPHFISTESDLYARFDGKFVLSGVFHTGADGIVFLKPDRAAAARLPRWKESAAPTEIWFENADAAVAAIGKHDRHVTLDVDRYTIRIECDSANYSVRFLSVHAPSAVAHNVQEEEGC